MNRTPSRARPTSYFALALAAALPQGCGQNSGAAAAAAAEATGAGAAAEADASGAANGTAPAVQAAADGASVRSTPSVPTSLDPLPTGDVSGVEIAHPGEVNPPGGGSSAPKTNPYCPDEINSGAATCEPYVDDLKRRQAAYCDFKAMGKKDSEGNDLVYPDLEALEKAGSIANRCCKAGLPVAGAC